MMDTEMEMEMEMPDAEGFTCVNCEEGYLTVNENEYISEVTGDSYCDTCWYEQFEGASTAWLVEDGEAAKYLVTEHGTFDEDLDLIEGTLTRTYHRTDGWRGYYETKPLGKWREVAAGWTTGNWGDEVSDGKQAFNRWVEGVLAGDGGDTILGCPIWVIVDPTSNVFSTAVGVYVPADIDVDDVEALGIPGF